jgi:hypothetical protein
VWVFRDSEFLGLGAGLPLGQLLIKDHVEGRGRYRAPHRVPPERAPVLAGLDHQQDVAVGEDDADGEHAAGDGFPQDLQERERRVAFASWVGSGIQASCERLKGVNGY